MPPLISSMQNQDFIILFSQTSLSSVFVLGGVVGFNGKKSHDNLFMVALNRSNSIFVIFPSDGIDYSIGTFD